MKCGGKQKNRLQMIIICFLLSCVGIIATIPLHEAAHWIMSDIDPYSEPVEFHLFDFKSSDNRQHILSSALGYVTIKESYTGSFKDKPKWLDPVQELICISIQILITLIIVIKTLGVLSNKNQKMISVS
jgi:hypothetical protein